MRGIRLGLVVLFSTVVATLAPSGAGAQESTNHGPFADAVEAATQPGTPVVLTLSGEDADGDPLKFGIYPDSGPAHGTLGPIDPNHGPTSAHVTYTPAAGYQGPDEFSYVAQDPSGAYGIALVQITIAARPPAPTSVATEAAVLRISPASALGATALLPGFAARLTTGGAPLPGRALRFSVAGTEVCGATTDASGVASCGGSAAAVQALTALGYTATYAGEPAYLPSGAKGPIVQVVSLRL